MKNADKPAMGQSVRTSPNHTHIFVGLTKREWFAGLAMQNMIEPDCVDMTEESMNKFCHALSWRSRRMADAVLEELDNA